MLESCSSVHDAVHLYRRRYALPARVVSDRPAIMTTEIVGAVTMPPAVGTKVLAALPFPAPVVGDLRDTRWTFLVRPNCPVPACLAAQLAEQGVTVARRGRVIVLPGSDSGWGARWVSEPVRATNSLPGQREILAAAYRCAEPIPHSRIG